MQTLLDHTYKTSNKWMWGGVAFIFAAAVFFNLLVNLALAFLSSALADVPCCAATTSALDDLQIRKERQQSRHDSSVNPDARQHVCP